MNVLFIFLTGLTTGGLSCLAMQGGLLASVIANQKEQEHDKIMNDRHFHQRKRKTLHNTDFTLTSFDQLDWMPVLMFLSTKLFTHTLLGFLLGALGSAITLSVGVRLIFQTFTALFMFATAMNLLNVHPIFRYVVFQPPKFLTRIVRNVAKHGGLSTTSSPRRTNALFAPGLLGALTIFVPCGVTQAMEVLAINSGNPMEGALIMFSFVLGTSPLFALVGVATAKLSEGWYQKFTKFAAYSLIAMALYGFNGVLLVMNSPLTINTFTDPLVRIYLTDQYNDTGLATINNGVQQVTINVLNNGYQPNYVKVKNGQPVHLTLNSNGVYSCALSFILKEFGIKTFLEATDSQSFTFTPTKTGRYQFTCSMGMYTGILEVI